MKKLYIIMLVVLLSSCGTKGYNSFEDPTSYIDWGRTAPTQYWIAKPVFLDNFCPAYIG